MRQLISRQKSITRARYATWQNAWVFWNIHQLKTVRVTFTHHAQNAWIISLFALNADGLTMNKKATLEDSIKLCRLIEAIAPRFGCHVALTGGTLYKDGERKDIDILFYRIRQVEKIDETGPFEALSMVGIVKKSGFGWCYKAEYEGINIDMFFPEETEGDYNPG